MEKRIERIFWQSVMMTFIIKALLAAAIPVTSDEAYFLVWGRYLDFGYYDHPPMVGWILYLVHFIGNSPLLFRLPAVLFSSLVGVGIFYAMKERSAVKAALAGTLFLLSPLNILNVLITTDTPLFLFAFSSGIFLYFALQRGRYVFYALSGVFLGLSFLSKYFAALLGFAYLVYFLLSTKDARKTGGFVLLFLAALPFVCLNLYWNYTHCWVNILFNLFNRNKKETFSLMKVLLFVLGQAYLVTPPVIYYLVRRRGKPLPVRDLLRSPVAVLAAAFIVPLGIFALLSFKKVVGLHWPLAFYPFMYLVLAVLFAEDELLKSIRFMVFFSLVHLLIVAVALSLPLRLLQHNKNFGTIILGTRPSKVLLYLRQFEGSFRLSTPSYADSALLTYHSGNYFAVFGGGSHHGRQDDIITDFRQWQGQDVLVVRTSEPREEEYAPFFDRVEINRARIDGAVFYFVLGYGFNYGEYKTRVLDDIREKYYQIPSFLPYPPSSCYFLNKYYQ